MLILTGLRKDSNKVSDLRHPNITFFIFQRCISILLPHDIILNFNLSIYQYLLVKIKKGCVFIK